MNAHQGMYEDFVRDALTEKAIEAAARVAEAFGDETQADTAWKAVFTLKTLRRPEVVSQLDARRLERIS